MFTNELIITAEEKRFKTIMEILYKLQTTDIQIIITVIEIEIIENEVINSIHLHPQLPPIPY